MMKLIERLQRKTYLRPGMWMHVARATPVLTRPTCLHTHTGFTEVFWVEKGSGLHVVNGQRVALHAGDLVLMRESDRHGFAGMDGHPLVLVNVAFDARILPQLRRRYFPKSPQWPWLACGRGGGAGGGCRPNPLLALLPHNASPFGPTGSHPNTSNAWI